MKDWNTNHCGDDILEVGRKLRRVTTPQKCRNHVKDIAIKVRKTQLDITYSKNE